MSPSAFPLLGLFSEADESVLAADAASISLTIPDTGKHLLIIASLRGTTAATAVNSLMRLNGDTGSNYDNQRMNASGATPDAGESFGDSGMNLSIPAASATASVFGGHVIFIPNYVVTTQNKVALIFGARKIGTASTNLQTRMDVAFWRNSNAITSVTLLPTSGNLLADSRASAYLLG
jgi:hypothetical protein